jgi:O-antigen/teichoic acid export membrane protein
MTRIMSQVRQLSSNLRFTAFDTSTSEGRSRERYRRALLTSLASALSKFISISGTLISVPLTFRYLGQERYGIWMVLASIISAMSFADLGIGNGLMNAVSEAFGKDDYQLMREYVSSAFFLMVGLAAIFAAVGGASYPFVPWMRLFNVRSEQVASEGARAFLVLFCWFVMNIPLGVVTRVQSGMQLGYLSNTVNAIGGIVSLLSLLLVIADRGSLAWLVFSSTIGVIIATALNAWLLLRKHPWLFPLPRTFRRSSASRIMSMGLMFFVLQCAIALGYTSDNIVIAQVLGATAVATYSVPQKLFSVVSMLVSMALTPLWPAYGEASSRGDFRWVRRAFFGSIRVSLAIAVPFCVFLVLTGPKFLEIAVGKSLHAPTSLLVVLAIWGIVYSISAPIAMLLNGAGILRAQSVLAVIASVSNLALSIYLTRHLGVIGVCLGSIVTQLLITFPGCFFIIRNVFRNMVPFCPVESKSTIPKVSTAKIYPTSDA